MPKSSALQVFIPPFSDWAQARNTLANVVQDISTYLSKAPNPVNMQGQTVSNVADPVKNQDVVTLNYLQGQLASLVAQLPNTPAGTNITIIEGTSTSTSTGTGTGGTIGSTVISETLTMASTVLSPPTPGADGNLLTYVLIQDGTGGHQITWGTNVKYTTIQIDTTPNTQSIFHFFALGGIWYPTGFPITGAS